jgi:tRNA(Phe) wybutosine-synthesizing methylase Tyw3
MKQYRIISPDGFDIEMDATYKKEDIKDAIKRFKDRYKTQGYYSACSGRISLAELEDNISVIEI